MLHTPKLNRAIAIIAILLATVVVTTPKPAGAQAVGCESASTSAATESELVDSIDCYAAQTPAGPHNVTITQDIELTALLPAIGGGSSFTILGDGHRLVVPATLTNARALSVIEPGQVNVNQLAIDMSGSTTSEAIVVEDGFFFIHNSVIQNSAVGVRVDGGRFGSGNTVYRGHRQAVVQSGGIVSFFGNTVMRTDFGGRGLHQLGGHAILVNSTFSGLGVAVDAASPTANIRLQSSTIARNNVGALGPVSAESSLIAENATDCVGLAVNVGGSFDGDGTCGFAPLAGGALGDLADNGCTTATPIGCVNTHALLSVGPWINGGECRDVPYDLTSLGTFVRDDLASDQRGFDRNVAGRCDAGAFESTLLPVGPLCDGLNVTINMIDGASGVGTAGDDVILGTAGADTIDAGAGNDTVCAGEGDDTIVGGDGDDTIFAEGGRDIARGNTGIDLIEGGDGNDRLLGGIGDDTINGGDGDDYIGGFGGDDIIDGGPGSETIFGGFGADRIQGGPGNDVIRGLIGDDVIFGNDGDDVVDGDRGNDRISGGSGDDVLRGGNANDILNGESGDDSLSGGKADDVLSGGSDTDICVGNLETVADTADSTCETIFGVP